MCTQHTNTEHTHSTQQATAAQQATEQAAEQAAAGQQGAGSSSRQFQQFQTIESNSPDEVLKWGPGGGGPPTPTARATENRGRHADQQRKEYGLWRQGE